MAGPVVIAGGGPVGMTTALLLARHGVGSVVLEAEQAAQILADEGDMPTLIMWSDL